MGVAVDRKGSAATSGKDLLLPHHCLCLLFPPRFHQLPALPIASRGKALFSLESAEPSLSPPAACQSSPFPHPSLSHSLFHLSFGRAEGSTVAAPQVRFCGYRVQGGRHGKRGGERDSLQLGLERLS